MNARCCELHCSVATATASVELENEMVPAVSSSGVANITHFKNHQVLFPHHIT
jgi:hypothetical protein